MNVRRGPGTNYGVIGIASAGETFDITGKNANGSWWRIDYKGQNAWIYAAYVQATNADRIRSVPTPASPATPTPQPKEEEEWNDFDYAYALSVLDRQKPALKQKWDRMSADEKYEVVNTNLTLLRATAEYCNTDFQTAAEMISHHGNSLDGSGYTARNDIRPRAVLILVLTSSREAERTPNGCDLWLTQGVRRILASE